jgi:CHAD domain-containing protein
MARQTQRTGNLKSPRARRGRVGRHDGRAVRNRRAPALRPCHPAVTLAYRSLVADFEKMLAEEPNVRTQLDPEHVHQMRVATRRMRASLRAFKKVLPVEARKNVSSELKWLAQALGNVRDLDVQYENVQKYRTHVSGEDAASLIDYQNHLVDAWQQARAELFNQLAGDRYRELVDSLKNFLRQGPPGVVRDGEDVLSIGAAARQLMGKQRTTLLRRGRAIDPDSPDDDRHALRIECKRLRYLLEFFRPVYGKPLNRYVKRLKKLQNVLGELQDARVAVQQLREYAERVKAEFDDGAAQRSDANVRRQLSVLNELIETEQNRAASRRAEFQKVWNRFPSKCKKNELLAVLT